MKKVFLFAVMAVAIAFIACRKDDDPVDVSQLVGKWSEAGIIGPTRKYTFDKDGGYKLVISSVTAAGPYVYEGKYEVSTNDGKIVRLSEDGSGNVEEYFLLELNSKEMKWREVVYGGDPREQWFGKVKE